MTNWYEEKMNFHYRQWELSKDTKKEKAAEFHMQEYLNYKDMYDIRSKR